MGLEALEESGRAFRHAADACARLGGSPALKEYHWAGFSAYRRPTGRGHALRGRRSSPSPRRLDDRHELAATTLNVCIVLGGKERTRRPSPLHGRPGGPGGTGRRHRPREGTEQPRRLQMELGLYEDALDTYQRCLAIKEKLGDRRRSLHPHQSREQPVEAGPLREALDNHRRALAVMEARGIGVRLPRPSSTSASSRRSSVATRRRS